MKELILWKEVDVKDELPEKEGDFIIRLSKNSEYRMARFTHYKEWYAQPHLASHDFYYVIPVTWLKRVVIPILSDQEIEELSCKGLDRFDAKLFKCNDCDIYEPAFVDGYKAIQERLIGGNI